MAHMNHDQIQDMVDALGMAVRRLLATESNRLSEQQRAGELRDEDYDEAVKDIAKLQERIDAYFRIRLGR
ncbi:MAG: hypothetical protein CL878_06060 [Dehalococcoidia bacterium]|nr:hypothetical protein [Dehalococcoidia bacterium]